MGPLVAAALLAGACTVDGHANDAYTNCRSDDDCGTDGPCRHGFCLGSGTTSAAAGGREPDAGDAGDAGSVPAGGSDQDAALPPPAACDALTDEPETCYDGPPDSLGRGRCRAGTRQCMGESWSACRDQIVPATERCNDEDDDCDGRVDEQLDGVASCETLGEGNCANGVLVCAPGGSAVCAQVAFPRAEICDGEDNDCNGAIDDGEVGRAFCYPDDAPGCSDAGGDGVYECTGSCRAGMRQCIDGSMQDCEGAVLPAPESCTGGADEPAADEDCDGVADEGCTCADDQMQSCYGGPAGTAEIGTCMRGVQTCSGNDWGACAGEILPAAETCENESRDDDCNGIADDIPLRGTSCFDDQNEGRCRRGTRQCAGGELACVTPEPRDEICDGVDDDCDGRIDNGFNLQDDEDNCGVCDHRCAPGETCCSGSCVTTGDDPDHCGTCGNRCGSGHGCCNGTCDPLDTAQRCGRCDVSCAPVLEGCCGDPPRCMLLADVVGLLCR